MIDALARIMNGVLDIFSFGWYQSHRRTFSSSKVGKPTIPMYTIDRVPQGYVPKNVPEGYYSCVLKNKD